MGLSIALYIFAFSLLAMIVVLLAKRKELGKVFKILAPVCIVVFIITAAGIVYLQTTDDTENDYVLSHRTEETRKMDMIMWYDIDISPLSNDRPERGWWFLNPQHPDMPKLNGCFRTTTPLLGLYDQRKPETARQHLYWISALGCNVIAADWTNFTSYRTAQDAGWLKYTKGVYDNTEVLLDTAQKCDDFDAPKVYLVLRLFGEDYDKLRDVLDDVYALYSKYKEVWYTFNDGTQNAQKPFIQIFADHSVLSKFSEEGPLFTDKRFNIRWSNGYLGSIGTVEGDKVAIPYGTWLFVENEMDEANADKGLYRAYHAKGPDKKPEQMIAWASVHKSGTEWDPLNKVIDGKTTFERTIWKVKELKPKALLVNRFNYAIAWLDEPQEGVSLYESTHIEPNEDFGFLIFDNIRENLYDLNNWEKTVVQLKDAEVVGNMVKVPLDDYPTKYRISTNSDMSQSEWAYLNINSWIDISDFDFEGNILYLQLGNGFGESEVIEVKINNE